MGKNKIIIKHCPRTYIIYKNKLCWYTGRQRLYYGIAYPNMEISIDDFINDENVYNKIINSEFNHIDVLTDFRGNSDFRGNLNSRNDLVAYFRHRKEMGDDYIATYKKITPQDIDSFYCFNLEITYRLKIVTQNCGDKNTQTTEDITIDGGPFTLNEYPNMICVMEGGDRNILATRFGYKKGGVFPIGTAPGDPDCYLVPTSKIVKIIGVKQYKNNNWIGTNKEYDFNGKEERIELDLTRKDGDIYYDKDKYEQIRQHGKCLEITEGEDDETESINRKQNQREKAKNVENKTEAKPEIDEDMQWDKLSDCGDAGDCYPSIK